jgi:O-antigen/teichoic acid export membrane protein
MSNHRSVCALVDQGVVSVTSFGTGVIIARSCTREGFGIYVLGLSVVYAIMNIQTSLITSPFTVQSATLADPYLAQYKGSTLLHQLTLSAAATVLLVAAASATPYSRAAGELPGVLWTLAFTIAFITLREYARQVCFATFQWHSALLLDLCVAVMQGSILLFLSRAELLTPSRAFLTIGGACGIASGAWLIKKWNTFMPAVSRAVLDMKWNWNFGKWILGASLLLTAGTQIFPWALTVFYGAQAAGLLAAAIGAMSFSNPLLIGIQNVTGPAAAHAYARAGSKELRVLILRTSAIAVTATCCFVAVMLFWGERVLVFVYGNKYSGTGILVGILALEVLPSALTSVVCHGLRAIRRPDVGCKAQLLRTVVALTLGMWLVKMFGPAGAAGGLLLGTIVATTYEASTFFSAVNKPNAADFPSVISTRCPSYGP